MQVLTIYNSKIGGEVTISGAKNSALPLLAMTLLAKNRVHISNIPNVADINTMIKLLKLLGSKIEFENGEIEIDNSQIHSTTAIYDIVRKMRASILVLGPLLARFKECEVSLPGGCAIGLRPVDLHLKALEKMGAKIKIENGYIHAKCEKLKGTEIVFDKITVTGTENIIMAAVLAKGTTKILNAAKEPEVVQLCEVLAKSGVKIEGIGTSSLSIEGTDGELIEIADLKVIPDRIEAGTYLCAGAISNSKVTIKNIIPEHLENIISKLGEMGFGFKKESNQITILPTQKIEPVNIVTSEHPGFPTDMQAQFMAVATQAEGVSSIEETLFENRFMHIAELQRLGAKIKRSGKVATIYGKSDLIGADIMATDLRASSALVLAGIIAEDKTTIHRIYHLFRGYENLTTKLEQLGVKLKLWDE